MLRALAFDASSERNVSLRLLFRFEISDGWYFLSFESSIGRF
jgi:hypothetical protein